MLRHYRERRRAFPWRETRDPYAVLIGELMLQRTRGENVVDVYRTFLERWPDPEALAEASDVAIATVIRPLGLAKRARMLGRLGREIRDAGGVPRTPERLLEFHGVGRYAAHAVPIFAGHRNLPLVDWVIARVLRRYYGLKAGRRPNADPALWELADHLASRRRARELWLGTLDFAAASCKPRPLCRECSLQADCSYAEPFQHQT